MTQTPVSNGSLSFRDDLRAWSIGIMNGGLSGCFQLPKMFLRPQSDHLILSWSDSDSGSGQPWAICPALTPERYLPIVSMDTGSKGQSLAKDWSHSLGSVTAQIAKECKSLKDTSSRALLGIEKYHRRGEIYAGLIYSCWCHAMMLARPG